MQDTTWGTITEPEQFNLDVCDDHFCYPARLALLFREIGASSWERRRQLSLTSAEAAARAPLLTQQDFELDADTLLLSITEIESDILHSSNELSFYPGVREELSESDVRDFTACTEAYLCMARILVERRKSVV